MHVMRHRGPVTSALCLVQGASRAVAVSVSHGPHVTTSAPAADGGFAKNSADLPKRFKTSDGIDIGSGDVLIAAITSCTNTSNPGVLIAAGLLAKKAVEKGLTVKKHIKTSLAPGSRVVTDYLKKAGLLPYLEKLGFYLAGYGCTTCIGNAGPLAAPIEEAITSNDLVCAAVLSGNLSLIHI